MNRKEIFQLHMAQSENVRYLKKALPQINLIINNAIKKGDEFQLDFYTKSFALLYSAWSEAQFTQIAYTPDGFLYSEICKIMKAKDASGISEGWRSMISLAITKVGKVDASKDLRERLSAIQSMVKCQIEEPSTLRNKLAHGQWVKAFNSKNTSLNPVLTSKISSLDPVNISKNIEIHTHFGEIVRDLIQSPKNGFHKNYWNHITSLEQYIEKTKRWSLSTKQSELLKKKLAGKFNMDFAGRTGS
jgi:hypothetical protein